MATNSLMPGPAPLPEGSKPSEGPVERFQTKPEAEDAGNETIEGRLARLEEEDIQEKFLKPVERELRNRLGRTATNKEIRDYLTKIETQLRDAFQKEKGWHAIDVIAFHVKGAEYGVVVRTIYGSPGKNGKYQMIRRDINLSPLRERIQQKPTEPAKKIEEKIPAAVLAGATDIIERDQEITLADLKKWGDEIPGTPEGGHFLGLFDELPASPDYDGDIQRLRADIQAIDDAAAKLQYDYVQSPHAFRERARDLLRTLPDLEVIMKEVSRYQDISNDWQFENELERDTSLMGNIAKLYTIISNVVQTEGIPDEWPPT